MYFALTTCTLLKYTKHIVNRAPLGMIIKYSIHYNRYDTDVKRYNLSDKTRLVVRTCLIRVV